MKLQDDYDDDYDIDDDEYKAKNSSAMLMAVCVISTIVLLVFLLVLYTNKKSDSGSYNNKNAFAQSSNSTDINDDNLISGSKLTADDLDFWDDYPRDDGSESSNVIIPDNPGEGDDPSSDGKHFKIVYEDETEEWVPINEYLDRNDYNYAGLVYKKPFMRYYENNHLASYVGVDISKIDDYVDFNALKKAGVDYVMIKLGQRGYYSGELSIDDNFYDNYKKAKDAGLDVGVYFHTAALTKEEAIEEANFVASVLNGDNIDKGVSNNSVSNNSASQNASSNSREKMNIKYPVVYYNESINDGEIRTKDINQMQRTNIAIAFMDRIKELGYSPMLFGNEEWLVKKYSIGTLEGYDIWLDDSSDIPDYPYKFQMWRYSNQAQVSGVPGYANVNISFIDYGNR